MLLALNLTNKKLQITTTSHWCWIQRQHDSVEEMLELGKVKMVQLFGETAETSVSVNSECHPYCVVINKEQHIFLKQPLPCYWWSEEYIRRNIGIISKSMSPPVMKPFDIFPEAYL